MQAIWTNSPNILNPLRNLQTLYLTNSQIKTIPKDAFRDMLALKDIDFSGNQLSTWTANMFNFSQMSFINMSHNLISLVNKSSIVGLPPGISLDLQHNPFSCYCDLIWFREQMDSDFNGTVPSLQLLNVDRYICNTPEKMAGLPLKEFHPIQIRDECAHLPWRYILLALLGSSS